MDLENVIRRIRLGDQDALRQLVSSYGPGVYAKAYAKTQDRTLAREITRQTFKQLVAVLHDGGNAGGWELLLGSMARRNIDAYSQIPSEMQLIGHQLEQELFAEASDRAEAPDPSESEIYAATAGATLRGGAAPSAPQPAYRQPLAPQPAYQPAAAPQPAYQPAEPLSAADAVGSFTSDARSAEDDAPAPRRQPAKRRAAHARENEDELFDDNAPRHTFGGVCAVLLLVILCLALLWIVCGVVLSLAGYADTALFTQLGYVWFRQAFPQIALF